MTLSFSHLSLQNLIRYYLGRMMKKTLPSSWSLSCCLHWFHSSLYDHEHELPIQLRCRSIMYFAFVDSKICTLNGDTEE
jgi:hypothetical protein